MKEILWTEAMKSQETEDFVSRSIYIPHTVQSSPTLTVSFFIDLWYGLRNGGQVSNEAKKSTFALTPALWPVSLLYPKEMWASSCRTWSTSQQSLWAAWVQRSFKERKLGSYIAWNWQRKYKNFAKVKSELSKLCCPKFELN